MRMQQHKQLRSREADINPIWSMYKNRLDGFMVQHNIRGFFLAQTSTLFL